jgi:hypothetical protein
LPRARDREELRRKRLTDRRLPANGKMPIRPWPDTGGIRGSGCRVNIRFALRVPIPCPRNPRSAMARQLHPRCWNTWSPGSAAHP